MRDYVFASVGVRDERQRDDGFWEEVLCKKFAGRFQRVPCGARCGGCFFII